MMKKMWITCLVVTGLAGASQADLAVGTLINMDFDAVNGTQTGAGAVGSAGDIWNLGGVGNFNGMVDQGNTATGVSLFQDTVVGGAGPNWFGWGSDPLTQDYIYLRDNEIATIRLGDGSYAGVGRRFTIYVNGSDDLNANQVWKLHLLGAGDNAAQGANFMVKQPSGWQSISNSGYPAAGGISAGENYGVLSDLTPTTWGGGAGTQQFEFELYWYFTDPDVSIDQGTGVASAAGGGGNMYSAFNGFQLELVAVPEPSTFGLLGVFGGVLLILRRRLTH